MNVPSRIVSISRPGLRNRSRRGFTIVELLVASAITLVVLGLMVQITFSTLQTFDRVTGTLDAKNQARLIFDYLRRDFNSIIWRQDGNVWLLATVQPDQSGSNAGQGDANLDDADWAVGTSGTYKPGIKTPGNPDSSLRLEKPGGSGTDRWIDLADYRFGQAGMWLRFFSNQVTDLEPTPAPTAVSYQIVRTFPRPNQNTGVGADRERRYLLFRSVVRPGPVGTAANSLRSVLRSGYDLTHSDYNENTAPGGTIGLPLSVRKPDRDALLAINVIDFGVRFWRRDPATGRNILVFPARFDPATNTNFPSDTNLGYAISSADSTTVNSNQPSTTIPRYVPASGTAVTHGAHLATANFQTAGEIEGGYPDYVEVMVRILTEEGARTLSAYENGDLVAPDATTQATRDTYWWTLAEQHSTVFVDTIPLSARPF